jgi:hypothetical protein
LVIKRDVRGGKKDKKNCWKAEKTCEALREKFINILSLIALLLAKIE